MKPIPNHPSLKKKAKVEIEVSCCVYEPRVLGIQTGQTLVVKNTSPVAHNFNLVGGRCDSSVNRLIPSGGEIEVKNIRARARMPYSYSCTIHPWMRGYLRVFQHPYFTVTDSDGRFILKKVPTGRYRLMAWHEQGWVIVNQKNYKDLGKVLFIEANTTTDAGKISYLPPSD
jgi:plastocyanin